MSNSSSSLIPWLAGALAVLLGPALAFAQVPSSAYRVETVHGPRGIAPEISAVAFGHDGKLYATFRRGYIYSYDPESKRWRRFAESLHNPLGIAKGDKPGEFLVAQVPELTRVADTDGDGTADLFETVSDGWGLSGNYHEYIAGPVRDRQGNLYVSLGLSSGNADPRPPVRGELTRRPRKALQPVAGKVNSMGHYSPTRYRGCALQIRPDGSVRPFSCGFRQPNGIVASPEGEIFASDNQGGWVGTSPLHHVTDGAFHGHPASLNWHPEFLGINPVEADVAALDRSRKRPAILFPQGDMGGSTAGQAFDLTKGAFGPYAGQLFVAEWAYPRVLRVDFQKVRGEYQGAAFLFVEGNGLRMANNRMAFAPDGRSLYIAQTSRIWSSTEGLQRIVWQGESPFDILTMRLTREGFDVTFTKPADSESATNPANYSMTRYFYLYHSSYGSPKTDITPVDVSAVTISDDGFRASLAVDDLREGWLYDLRPSSIRSRDGEPLATKIAAYTLNRLPEIRGRPMRDDR